MKTPTKAAAFSVAACAFVTFAVAAQANDSGPHFRGPSAGEILFQMHISLHYAKLQSHMAAEDGDLKGARTRLRVALACLVQPRGKPLQQGDNMIVVNNCGQYPSAVGDAAALVQSGHPVDRGQVDKLQLAITQLQHGLNETNLTAAQHDAAAASATVAGVNIT